MLENSASDVRRALFPDSIPAGRRLIKPLTPRCCSSLAVSAQQNLVPSASRPLCRTNRVFHIVPRTPDTDRAGRAASSYFEASDEEVQPTDVNAELADPVQNTPMHHHGPGAWHSKLKYPDSLLTSGRHLG